MAPFGGGKSNIIGDPKIASDSYVANVQQDLQALGTSDSVIRALYSVGFIGVADTIEKSYVFCHDGRSPGRELHDQDKLIVHPCYWIALNIGSASLSPEEAGEVSDQFDIGIKVVSETPVLRRALIDDLIGTLTKIPMGRESAAKFEEWCCSAIKIILAGRLRNIELKPNRASTERRDVVGTNGEASQFWKRVLRDYSTRQVVFEIENYTELTADEFRQILSYMTGPYGKIGFIVTRDVQNEPFPHKGTELDQVRTAWHQHDHRLPIKLTAPFLVELLNKLAMPQKHDEPDRRLNKLLDSHERLYISLPSTIGPSNSS